MSETRRDIIVICGLGIWTGLLKLVSSNFSLRISLLIVLSLFQLLPLFYFTGKIGNRLYQVRKSFQETISYAAYLGVFYGLSIFLIRLLESFIPKTNSNIFFTSHNFLPTIIMAIIIGILNITIIASFFCNFLAISKSA